jgi:hypothetical protein
VIQPTTNFGRFRRAKSTIIWSDDEPASKELANAQPIVDPISGVTVDASCNTTITLSCLQQIYNFVGYKPSSKNNSIGITGYLDEYANLQDLQSFYADQRPDALGSSFKFVSVKGVSPVRGRSSSLLTSVPSRRTQRSRSVLGWWGGWPRCPVCIWVVTSNSGGVLFHFGDLRDPYPNLGNILVYCR